MSSTITPNPLDAEVWLFDLDNTLYSHHHNLFDQVAARMTLFIMETLKLPRDAARILQSEYFHKYGTTLSGLMQHHNIPPDNFLNYVHDIDYSALPPNPVLDALLDCLPARKIIFTNGPSEHAQSVVRQLGITRHFSEIFDIVDSDYTPKPALASYQRLIAQYSIDPTRALMIEDIATNLKHPKALNMQTVFIHTDEDWAKPQDEDNFIDHEIYDLTVWLNEVLV